MRKNSVVHTDNLVPGIDKQKIFFGEYSGFQRYDQPKYTFAVDMEETMRNAFWNPKEISLLGDRIKFPDLPQFVQEIETEVLLYQTLMDSGNNRGIDNVLSVLVTSPEFESMFKTHAYFELLHSFSYSHILREVFPNATEVFDSVANRTEIHNRINKEIECFEKVKNVGNIQQIIDIKDSARNDVKKLIEENNISDPTVINLIMKVSDIYDRHLNIEFDADMSEEDRKKIILELIVRIYVLESLKFYISFLVTYVINNSYNNKIQGITRIIKLINFDEDFHISVMAGVLDILKREESEGFKELINTTWFTDMVESVFVEVVEDEISWGKHLLSFGPLPTLTIQVLDNFIKHYANLRSRHLLNGKVLYEGIVKSDVVDFFENYKDIDKDNTAQQEGEALGYNVGILVNDIDEGVSLEFDELYDVDYKYDFTRRRTNVIIRKV